VIGHFPDGDIVTDVLIRCRRRGIGFDQAWTLALHKARRGRLATNPRWQESELALIFARPAFERAYEGQERTRQDVVATALLHAMEAMLDYSEAAQSTALMEAA
jgi:hypothetical protein